MHLASGEVAMTGSIQTGDRMVSLSCILTQHPFWKTLISTGFPNCHIFSSQSRSAKHLQSSPSCLLQLKLFTVGASALKLMVGSH